MFFVCFFVLTVTCFVHNVSAIVSFDQKAITNVNLDKDFYFNEAAAQDTLLTPDQALIPDTQKRKRL
jgi:hypothetical protein